MQNFNHQELKLYYDLIWVVDSTPVIKQSSKQFDFNLAQKNDLPKKITLWIQSDAGKLFIEQPVARRLGRYFEDLFAIILWMIFPDFDIERGIQIRQGKNTLGELDFVIKNGSDICLHVETAVKFYLCAGTTRKLQDFVGPQKRDRLDLKWHKILDHQLQTQPEEKILFSNRQYFLRGVLFYPWIDFLGQLPEYDELYARHIYSWWIEFNKLGYLLERYPEGFYLVVYHRNEWLSGARLTFEKQRYVVFDEFPEMQEPTFMMVADKNFDFVTQGFVVQNDWRDRPMEDRK